MSTCYDKERLGGAMEKDRRGTCCKRSRDKKLAATNDCNCLGP